MTAESAKQHIHDLVDVLIQRTKYELIIWKLEALLHIDKLVEKQGENNG